MLSINTNSAASRAASNLNTTSSLLERSLQRLSSGSRIIDSSDDAGGLAVSMKMSASIRRTDAAISNVSNAKSFLKTQDGALGTATKVLTRMSELATLSQDVTKTSSDVANYQTEFSALQAQIAQLSTEKFNGVALFGGSSATSLAVSTNEDSTSTMNISQVAISSGNISTAIGTGASIATATSATTAVTTLKNALQELASLRATNGSESSRLEFAKEMLTTNRNNLEAANSRIIDVDVAAESTQLARFNILQQAGIAMLSQANVSSQSILRLIS